MSEKQRIVVDIVADFVCPWCFVGLSSFLYAKEELDQTFEVIPRFRAYQLNPDTPFEGVDRQAYYEKKFPDAAQREIMRARLIESAMAAGADFDPALPTRIPNTLRAHSVLRWAHYDGKHVDVAKAIYNAYWKKGADIGEVEPLAEIAGAAGMDGEKVAERLLAREDEFPVRGEADALRRGGVNGVPTFIVNERAGFAGALPPGQLTEALKKAATL
jgi:predicted DsbA family dithiol-disulfide isomerase